MDNSEAQRNRTESFFKRINQPYKFRIFLIRQLPAAFFSGIAIESATPERTVVVVPYRWSTKNPFRSTYFACLAMAAEMSTGILAMSGIYKRKPSVSMLVINMEANFFKKAIGKTRFICEEGLMIQQAIEEAITSETAQTIRSHASGFDEQNEKIADFYITWSFRKKNK